MPKKRGGKKRSRAAANAASGATAGSTALSNAGTANPFAKLLAHVIRAPSSEFDAVRALEQIHDGDDGDDARAPSQPNSMDDATAHNEDSGEDDEFAGHDDDDDDAKDAQWISSGYDAHYGAEWTPAELDERKASWRDAKWELAGLGKARARVATAADVKTVAPPAVAVSPAAGPAAAPSTERVLRKCGILPPLRAAWRAAHGDTLSPAQASLLGLLTSRTDVHAAGTAHESYPDLIPILALHAAQHLVVTQKMLQRHKKKNLAPQDRGFTKPSVLVMLPFRSHALAFMQELLALLPPCYEQVENKARFLKEYEEEEGAQPMPASKPDDYKVLFDGNHDDCFRCAMRLTRKAAKLYAPFYSADLIVGSPLGLRTLIGEGEGGGKKVKRAKDDKTTIAGDADWLSSIELAIVGFGDVLLMQNWAHVHDLFELLNRLPTQARDTDFSRVRPWYLEGDAKRVRQTAMLSQYPAAEFTALLTRQCANALGHVTTLPTFNGVLAHTPSGIRQLMVRFECNDPVVEAEQRLAAFRDRLLPSLLTAMTTAHGQAQTMLFVPRYFDFVRVRQLLTEEDVPFASVSEYSTPQQVSRARTALQKREVPLLVYTERAHFFRRHKLRGARHLAVYSPPSYPQFYTELMQQLDRAHGASLAMTGDGNEPARDATCVMLFCKLDVYPLQRLVGNERAARMLSASEASFLFA